MTDPVDILAVMAHPDDAALLCGGALAKSARAGERVAILDLTRGEMGSWGSPETRHEEAMKAAEAMGVEIRRNAGLSDAALDSDQIAREAVVTQYRELRPRVVVTHWLRGRHRDHRIAAEIARDSAFLSGLKNFPAHGDPYRPEKVVYATLFREDAPDPRFVVDITDTFEAKMAAIRCYSSQFDDRPGMGEVLPGGDRPVYETIEAHCAVQGTRIRARYGEPFWTEETVEVPTLGAATVPTFGGKPAV